MSTLSDREKRALAAEKRLASNTVAGIDITRYNIMWGTLIIIMNNIGMVCAAGVSPVSVEWCLLKDYNTSTAELNVSENIDNFYQKINQFLLFVNHNLFITH